jgi:predicted metal-dependent phosphoesterase TrpH
VAAYARKGGVDAWALTDHDEVGGIKPRAPRREQGMRFVPASRSRSPGPTRPCTSSACRSTRTTRSCWRAWPIPAAGATRADARSRPARLGRHPERYEGALKYVGNPDLLSRTHFARYLVEAACANTRSVPQIPDRRQARLCAAPLGFAGRCDGWIRSAGGIPSSPIPGRYKFSQLAEGALFDEFKQLGGECHRSGDRQPYAGPVREYAEWRGATASWPRAAPISMRRARRASSSRCRRLPANVTPVWHDWF